MDVASLQVIIQTKGVEAAQRELDKLSGVAGKAEKSVGSLSNSFKGLENSTKSLISPLNSLQGAFAALGAISVSKTFIQTADAMTLLQARIGLVNSATDSYKNTIADLSKIANESRASLDAVGQLYVKIKTPLDKMGASTHEAMQVTEAFSKALLISGASAQESSTAIFQFAQAMASGRLQGDEFRAIAESSPRFLRALSDELGISAGALKTMASEGKLTVDVIGKGMLQALEKLRAEVKLIPPTVSGAFQILKNEATLASDEINKAYGITKTFASGLVSLSDGVKNVSENVNTYGRYLEVAATTTAVMYTATKAATLYETAYNAIKAQSTVTTTAYNIATNQTTTIVTRLTASQVAATLATNALNTALRLSPYVIVAGTIGVLANAFLSATEKSDNLKSSLALTNKELKELTANQLNYKLVTLEKSLTDTYEEIQKQSLKARGVGMFGLSLSDEDKLKAKSDLDTLIKHKDGIISAINQIKDAKNVKTDTKKSGAFNVLPTEQVKEQVKDAIGMYKDYYASIGDEETVLAIKRYEYSEKYKNLTNTQIDEMINAERNKHNKTEKLAEEWAKRKIELATETAIAEQDEMSKPYILLQAEYEADLKQYGHNKDAKAELDRNYEAKKEKLNKETIKKFEDGLEKEAKKSAEWQIKMLEANEKYNDEIIKMQDEMYGTDSSVEAWYNNQLEYLGKLSQEAGATAEELQTLLDKIETLKAMKLQKQTISFKVEQSFYQSFENNLADSIEDAFNGDLNFKKFFRNIGNDLLKTVSSSFAGIGTNMLRGNYASALMAVGASSISGASISASDISGIMNAGGVFNEATNAITTAGGTVINLGADGGGTVASVGSDAMSLINNISTLKTAYSLATEGLTGYFNGATSAIDSGLSMFGMGGSIGGGAMFVNPLTGTATSLATSGTFINPATLTAQSTLSTGGVAAQGASYGTIAGGALVGGAVGYGAGALGDAMFGAKTYAPVTGALGGAAAGGLYAAGAISGPVGWAVLGASLLLGGLFGKKEVTDVGYQFFDNMTALDEITTDTVKQYSNWEKNSWFSSKSGTDYSNLSSKEMKQIESVFDTYDYLLAQLGDTDKIFLSAGKYTGATFGDELSKNFISLFTDIPQKVMADVTRTIEAQGFWGGGEDGFTEAITTTTQEYVSNAQFDEIYQAWVDYAEAVDKTVMEAFTESVSSFITSKRTFELWSLGDSIESLQKQAEWAQADFDNLSKSIGASGVTVDNFLTMYDEAVKGSFTPETIAQWDALGDSLMKAVDANKAYTDSIVDVEKEALIASQTLQNNFVNSIQEIVKTLQEKYNPALKTTADIMTRFAELTGIEGIYNVKSWEDSAGALSGTKANEEALTLFGAIGEAMYKLEAQVKITVASLLKQGKALEALNLALSIADKPNYKDFTDKDGNFYAHGFNVAYAKVETELAKKLAEDISANALFVENAMGAFQDLNQKIIATTQSQYGILFQDAYQQVAYGIAEAVTGSAEKTSKFYDVIGITTEFSKSVAEKQGMGYLPSGQGIADLMNKEAQASYVGSLNWSSRLGKNIFGEDMHGFDQALTSLDGALKKQIITTEEYTKAVQYLSNDVYDLVQGTEDLMAFYQDIEAQEARAAAARYAVITQAVTSTQYYFDVITKSADTYLDTLKETGATMAVASSAIGRFNSMMDVFNYTTSRINVDAIKNNFGDYENAKFVKETGALIAKAAGIASAEVTTADAKLAAERIANTASFSGTDATTIQRLSLMFDGFQAFDSGAFENTLMLINSELIKGNITQEQYADLFNQSLDIYRDVEDKQLKTLKSIERIVADISAYQRELLYGDLSTLSLSEKYAGAKDDTMGLYAQAKAALIGGDLDLFETLYSDFEGVSANFLTVSKDFVANNEAYVQDFTSVFGVLADLKSLATTSGLNVGSDLNYLKLDGSHANGLDYVPFDGYIAQLHKGERVQTSKDARSTDALASEIRLLRQDLKDSNQMIAFNTQRTAKILDRWDADGQPEERVV